MLGKLAFFCLGFALGTRTGRQTVRQLAGAVSWTLRQDEVQSALGLAQSAAVAALERSREFAARRAA